MIPCYIHNALRFKLLVLSGVFYYERLETCPEKTVYYRIRIRNVFVNFSKFYSPCRIKNIFDFVA